MEHTPSFKVHQEDYLKIRIRKTFLNRHVVYPLNLLVTAGPDHIIYDVVENAPGRSHDAVIYRQTGVKSYLESSLPRQICLGDKGFV